MCVDHPLRTIDERCTFVAPRKALRSCPTSLTACLRSRRDVFRPLVTASLALFRSLTSLVVPRAPRERSLAPAWLRHMHRFSSDGSRSLDSPRSGPASACYSASRLAPRRLLSCPVPCARAHGVCLEIPRPRVHPRPPHPLRSHAPRSFASTSSSASIEASPPRPPSTLPKEALVSERAKGTSDRRLQPTFFRCQRRAALFARTPCSSGGVSELLRLVMLPGSLLRAFALFAPRWSAPFHGEHTPLRRVPSSCASSVVFSSTHP